MSERHSVGSVKVRVTVPVEQQRAFDVFVNQMHEWWPSEIHILHGDASRVIVETRANGRWFEQRPGRDGDDELDWGRVLAYEPPNRLSLAWQLSPRSDWDDASDEDPGMHYDAALRTDLEIIFATASEHRTSVALEHRHLDALGEGHNADAIRELLAGNEVGWPYIVDHYASFIGRIA